jgi:hypothetical protein
MTMALRMIDAQIQPMTPSAVALAASGALLRAEEDGASLPTYVVAALHAASELAPKGCPECPICFATLECDMHTEGAR